MAVEITKMVSTVVSKQLIETKQAYPESVLKLKRLPRTPKKKENKARKNGEETSKCL